MSNVILEAVRSQGLGGLASSRVGEDRARLLHGLELARLLSTLCNGAG